MMGSEHNDEFYVDESGRTRTRTNRSGGIQVHNYLHSAFSSIGSDSPPHLLRGASPMEKPYT